VNVELWADLGLSRVPANPSDPTLIEDAIFVGDQQYTTEVVLSLLRAAYGAGYVHAHADDDRLTIREAMDARDELALRVPVE
jgi:hypothetical protein